MSAELDEDVIATWLRRSRESQGLPERIVDGAVLARVVTLALAPTAEPRRNGGNGHRGHGSRSRDGTP
jgi:hypothetical protein